MGVWGTGFFENDDAQGFVDEIGAQRTIAALARALDVDLDVSLAAPVARVALAAAELVAVALGQPDGDTPPEITDRYSMIERPGAQLLALAWTAADAVQCASQLKDLWANTDDFGEWNGRVEDLKARLANARS